MDHGRDLLIGDLKTCQTRGLPHQFGIDDWPFWIDRNRIIRIDG